MHLSGVTMRLPPRGSAHPYQVDNSQVDNSQVDNSQVDNSQVAEASHE